MRARAFDTTTSPAYPGFEATAESGEPRRDITDGLSAAQPSLSPKYLYDSLGSKLFEAITELPEYYPTRTEVALLERHVGSIAETIGPGATLVELGAGNCHKAARLFHALRPAQYVALDISAEFLEGALAALRSSHPGIVMIGVAADLTAGIRLPREVAEGRRLFLYLGSSIGNFDPGDALPLLADISRQCRGGGSLLIGVDLVKSAHVLQQAYDDPLGVTAAFNRNMLNHVNTLIGSNFDVRDWGHRAVFNARHSRMEMYLEAERDVLVAWSTGSRLFRRGERLHTENSYKYLLEDFKDLLRDAGFGRVFAWTDEREWFALCHAS